MNQMVGADVAELRALAAQFGQSATRLRTLSGQVGNGITISAWVGPVAVRFRHTWASEHSLRLRAAADLLDANAKVLRRNAAEQEAASASLAAGAGSWVVAGRPGGASWAGAVSNAATSWLELVDKPMSIALDAGSFLSDLAGKRLAPTLNPFFKGLGKVLAPIAYVDGLVQMLSAKDGYHLADGLVSAALGGAAMIAIVAFPPAGLAIGAVSLAWGVASYLSGDVPVSKRVVDIAKSAGKTISEAASIASEGATAAKNAVGRTARAAIEGPARLVTSMLRVPRMKFGF